MCDDSSLSDEHFETKDVGFITALKWLIYKNFKQQFLRRPCALACKLLFPAICIIFLGVIRGISKAESSYIVFSNGYNDAVTYAKIQPENWIDSAICYNDYIDGEESKQIRVFYIYMINNTP